MNSIELILSIITFIPPYRSPRIPKPSPEFHRRDGRNDGKSVGRNVWH